MKNLSACLGIIVAVIAAFSSLAAARPLGHLSVKTRSEACMSLVNGEEVQSVLLRANRRKSVESACIPDAQVGIRPLAPSGLDVRALELPRSGRSLRLWQTDGKSLLLEWLKVQVEERLYYVLSLNQGQRCGPQIRLLRGTYGPLKVYIRHNSIVASFDKETVWFDPPSVPIDTDRSTRLWSWQDPRPEPEPLLGCLIGNPIACGLSLGLLVGLNVDPHPDDTPKCCCQPGSSDSCCSPC